MLETLSFRGERAWKLPRTPVRDELAGRAESAIIRESVVKVCKKPFCTDWRWFEACSRVVRSNSKNWASDTNGMMTSREEEFKGVSSCNEPSVLD